MLVAVDTQTYHGGIGPGGDFHAVFLRQGADLVLVGDVLVGPPVIGVVHRPPVIAHHGACAQHGRVECGEVGAGDQYRDDQHVADGLPSLEFHHAGGDDVVVAAPAAAAPAVDHSMEQNQIKAYHQRRIEDG